MTSELKAGEKYTVFGVGAAAATYKRNIKITQFDKDGKPIFSEKGKGNCMKKKQYYLNTGKDVLIFEGWETPFKLTSEIPVDSGRGYTTRSFSGNAMLNFVGDKETIKDWIDNNNLNPDFTRKDAVLIWDKEEYPTKGSDSKKELLYPEAETTSSMVESLR